MPNVPKTSGARIVSAARKIIAKKGVEALSMEGVASAVGIRAPSLYKHFPNRAAIVQAVTRLVVNDLIVLQREAAIHASARENLRAISRVHRAFARKFPRLYGLVFDPIAAASFTREDSEQVVGPLLMLCAQVEGKPNALFLARALTTFTHGFVSMELAGAFHLSGDLDRAFEFGLERLLG